MDNIIIRLEPKEQVDQTVGDVAVAPSSNQSNMDLAGGDIGIETSTSLITTGNVSSSSILTKLGFSAAALMIAKKAYDLAEKLWEINRENQKNQRNQNEQLRQLGGAGFSNNVIGERFNVVTQQYTGGTNITYKRR